MEIEVLRDRADFAHLAGAWRRLCTSDSPFQRFDWWHRYLVTIQRDELCVLVARDHGVISGIAPLVRAGDTVRPICDHLTDHSLLWTGRAGPAVVEALRAMGVTRVVGYGVVERPATGTSTPVPCPVIDIVPGTDPTAGYARGLVERLRRSRPRLTALGELRMRVEPPTATTMARFLDRQYAWRAYTGHPERALTGDRRRFMLSLSSSEELVARTRIATLTAGDRHVSTILCFVFDGPAGATADGPAGGPAGATVGGTVGAFATAHEIDLAPYSPGLHGTDLLLRWAADNGLRRYDFLRGAEPYKSRFGARTGYHVYDVRADL